MFPKKDFFSSISYIIIIIINVLFFGETRPVARTARMERVRRTVNQTRIQRGRHIIETESESSDFDSEECESEMTSETDTDTDQERESLTENSGDEDEQGRRAVENKKYGAKKCSCIMCDETCQVSLVASTPTRVKKTKKAVGKKRKTTRGTKKRGSKRRKVTKGGKRKATKKGRKKYSRRRVTKSKSSTAMTKIIQTIRKAREQQMDLTRVHAQNPITLNSIEIEAMKASDSKKTRQSKFPPKATAWYSQTSILNEIDEYRLASVISTFFDSFFCWFVYTVVPR